MNETITIRFAKPADAEQIAICHVASWQKAYRGHIPDHVLDSLSVKEREHKWHDILNKNANVLVLERNNKIIGFASLCPARDQDTDPKRCGEIQAIYLHPEFWHQGLGKKICHKALSELEKMGFTEVIVWALKGNDQARQFYESMCFNETGDCKLQSYYQGITLNVVRYQKNDFE